MTKLNDAQVLFAERNRPIPAEKLIQEAIVIYEQRDDAHGLGNAWREYADFLESPAVTAWDSSDNDLGNFHDETVNSGDRQTVVAQLYRRALSYYDRAESELKVARQYDALTNVYFNSAWAHWKLGEIAEACADYNLAIDAYHENMEINPRAKPFAGRQGGTVDEAVASMKQRAGC